MQRELPSWGQSGVKGPPEPIPKRPEPRYEYVCLGTGAAHQVCIGALCHGCLPWLRPLLHPQLHPWLHSWVRPQPIRVVPTTKTESLKRLQNRLRGLRPQTQKMRPTRPYKMYVTKQTRNCHGCFSFVTVRGTVGLNFCYPRRRCPLTRCCWPTLLPPLPPRSAFSRLESEGAAPYTLYDS